MIKKIFIRDYHSSNSLIDNFKNTDLILLNYHVLLKNTVIKRNLIRLSKSTDKKRSDLSVDNFYCFFSNKYIKNI